MSEVENVQYNVGASLKKRGRPILLTDEEKKQKKKENKKKRKLTHTKIEVSLNTHEELLSASPP